MRANLRNESGVGGVFLASILFPFLILSVFALVLGMQGWGSAQARADDAADQAAKAAASATVTTPAGDLAIDCEKAEQAALITFAASRGVGANADRFVPFDGSQGARIATLPEEGDVAVAVECLEPIEATFPAYNYCPDTGGWAMQDDGRTCKREVTDRVEYYCPVEGTVLVGTKCMSFVTIYKCPDGTIVSKDTECSRSIVAAVCPDTPTLANRFSEWGGWSLTADKSQCVGTETAYYNPQLSYNCAVYSVSAPSTLVAVPTGADFRYDCYREPKEYYCAIGTMTAGGLCQYVAQTANVVFACPDGYTLTASNQCTRTDVWFTCTSSTHQLSGSLCSYQETTYPNRYTVWVCYSGTNGRDIGQSPSYCYQQQAVYGQVKVGTERICTGGYDKKGNCKGWTTRDIYENRITGYKWVVVGAATLVERLGTPVVVTRSYQATRNERTLTIGSTPGCTSGYQYTGSQCVAYGYTSRGVRSAGPNVYLGRAGEILTSKGIPASVFWGPVASTPTSFSINYGAAEQSTAFVDAGERVPSEPVFEFREFVTSASTETLYRGVRVTVYDNYVAPLGVGSADVSRTAEAFLEQRRISAS